MAGTRITPHTTSTALRHPLPHCPFRHCQRRLHALVRANGITQERWQARERMFASKTRTATGYKRMEVSLGLATERFARSHLHRRCLRPLPRQCCRHARTTSPLTRSTSSYRRLRVATQPPSLHAPQHAAKPRIPLVRASSTILPQYRTTSAICLRGRCLTVEVRRPQDGRRAPHHRSRRRHPRRSHRRHYRRFFCRLHYRPRCQAPCSKPSAPAQTAPPTDAVSSRHKRSARKQRPRTRIYRKAVADLSKRGTLESRGMLAGDPRRASGRKSTTHTSGLRLIGTP